MSALAKLWSSLISHQSNGSFSLPKTGQTDTHPKDEGPFGTMNAKGRSWFTRVTYGDRHATPMFYVLIGAILTAITLVEVWLFTVTTLGPYFVPILLILSAVKFVIVVGFFMHLRFDPKGFTWVFAAGMFLGIAVFMALLSLFFKLNG